MHVIRNIASLCARELLGVLKQIEKDMGRADGIRYGLRPIDLDMLYYGIFNIYSVTLVPHISIWERPFVVVPLIDLLSLAINSDTIASWHSFLKQPCGWLFGLYEKLGHEANIGRKGMKQVLPMGNHLWNYLGKTHVVGVLNLTPDSFSDGGKYQSVEAAVSQSIREEIAVKSLAVSLAPILIGPSRKKFFGNICSRPEANERDLATIAAVTAGVLAGAISYLWSCMSDWIFFSQEPKQFNDFLRHISKFCQEKHISSFTNFLASKQIMLITNAEAADRFALLLSSLTFFTKY
ncbi:hypothetical protein GIB67_019427 [Kingdonia uniflora]|uniref:2-amino-4-hydroxy-6-hydroxymethyldihydropteridine diphosphokinase n=1 Tax=Kingdonia uniflora TaxID=39325 RepID=A0A7J7L6M7_9MAGN|nr:hypothetical protein GIB67_019427 [Kingdonia uniflora]